MSTALVPADQLKRDGAMNKIPPRWRIFVDEYCRNGWNGTKAAAAAGLKVPDVQSSRLLGDARIQRLIEERLKSFHLSSDKVLQRLAAITNSNPTDFMGRNEQGGVVDSIDLEEVAKSGRGIVKGYTAAGEKTPAKLELHDSLRALELVGKVHGLFTDNIEINPSGNPIKFTVAEIDLKRV